MNKLTSFVAALFYASVASFATSVFAFVAVFFVAAALALAPIAVFFAVFWVKYKGVTVRLSSIYPRRRQE